MPRGGPAPLDPLVNPGWPAVLQFGALRLVGFSVSAVASYVLAPTLDAAFDLGHCPLEAVDLRHVFLSHVHQDHSLGAYRYLSLRAMQKRTGARVYVPAESRDAMLTAFRALRAMEQTDARDLDGALVGLAVGDEVSLGRGRRVQAFDVVHRVASRGFRVIETRRTLREAYRGLAGPEIAAAVSRGEAIYDEREHCALTYVGDSTLETLERHPEVGRSEVLFLEATHLEGTSAAVSSRWGHTHIDELAALYRRSPEVLASPHIVLKHFSLRYGRREIEAALHALPEGLRARVTLLLAPRAG